MERGALGSELDGNPAEQRAIWSREDPRFLGTLFVLHRLQCGMLILSVLLYRCNYRNTSYLYNSVFLSWSVLSCMRMRVAFPFSRNVVLSGRAVYANSCIAAGVCLGRVVTLMFVGSSTPSLD